MWKDITNFTQIFLINDTLKRTTSIGLFATLIATALLFTSGCKESPVSTGRDVIPASDLIQIGFTDTIGVAVTSRYKDSTNTYRAARQVFGNFVDPEFGRYFATTYTQLLPPSGLDFGDLDSICFDSVVLSLDIDQIYGKLETPQTLQIHPLKEMFPDKSEFYVFDSLSFDESIELSNDRIIDLSNNGGPGIVRVRLDDEWGQKILTTSADTLGDKDLYLQKFPGIALKTKPVRHFSREPGAIFTLFTSNTTTRLEIHYHTKNADGVCDEAKVESFFVSTSTPRFHQVKRTDFENRLLGLELDDPDTKNLFEFIQGTLPIEMHIQFPSLSEMDEVAVSRADLVMKVDPDLLGSNNRFAPPFQLESYFADSVGEIDISLGPLANPALYNAEDGTYTISLTFHAQQLISRQIDNNGIILVPNNTLFQMNRAVFGGSEHPTLAPKFELTFSTLPQ